MLERLEMKQTVKILSGNYKVVSMPFPNQQLAEEEIKEYWEKEDATTYFHGGWYIVIPE